MGLDFAEKHRWSKLAIYYSNMSFYRMSNVIVSNLRCVPEWNTVSMNKEQSKELDH